MRVSGVAKLRGLIYPRFRTLIPYTITPYAFAFILLLAQIPIN